MSILLVATKTYEVQRVTSLWQSTTKTNRDPNHDKTFARSNHPTTSEIYFSYNFYCLGFYNTSISKSEVQATEKTVPSTKIIKSDSKRFLAVRGLREDKSCDTLQAMAPTHVMTAYQTSLLHIDSKIRIVVAYPRLAFSSINRSNHAQISFDQQAQVSKDHMSCRNKEN